VAFDGYKRPYPYDERTSEEMIPTDWVNDFTRTTGLYSFGGDLLFTWQSPNPDYSPQKKFSPVTNHFMQTIDLWGKPVGPKRKLPDHAFVVGVGRNQIFAYHMERGTRENEQMLVFPRSWVDIH